MEEPLLDIVDNADGAVTLEAQRVSYFVEKSRRSFCGPPDLTALVVDASVSVARAEVVALLGPSGSGKTTLLSLLAKRSSGGYVSGRVLLDGVSVRPRSARWSRAVAYVEQHDAHHVAELTVLETLKFATALRLPLEPRETRDKRAMSVARSLELTPLLSSMVGGSLNRGISGGQLKRLSVACEAVGGASHFVLDEPTSGLDSRGALALLKVLRGLADDSLALIFSIHSPPISAMPLFDRVMLLVPGGQTLYIGPPKGLVRSLTPICAMQSGETDFDFAIRAAFHATPPPIPTLDMSSSREQPSQRLPLSFVQLTRGFGVRLGVLARRSRLRLARDPRYVASVVIRAIVLALLAFALFGRSGDLKRQQLMLPSGVPTGAASDCAAVLFFFVAYVAMNSVEAIPELFSRREAFERERAAGCVSPLAETLTAATARLPLMAASLTIFTLIAYPLLGFGSQFRLLAQSLMLVFTMQQIAFWTALTLASVSSTASAAMGLYPVCLVIALSLAGFNVAIPNLLYVLRCASVLSPARWTFQGLLVVNLADHAESDALFKFYFGNSKDLLRESTQHLFLLALLALAALYCSLAFGGPKPPRSLRSNEKAEKALFPQQRRKKPELNDNVQIEMGALTRKQEEEVKHEEPTSSMSLGFEGVRYSVTTTRWRSKEQLSILRGVDGCAGPREVLALLGASGAGKTTLLDVLAGRKTTGVIEGQVLYNGSPLCPGVRRRTAYLPQDVAHVLAMGCLTAGEALGYVARLRGNGASVDVLLRLAKLPTDIKTRRLSKVSGGELRRVALAIECAHLPSLIFADEPTTGLDARSAIELMRSLRSLVVSGERTVVATVHQPSPACFACFDTVLLLARGRCLYFGDNLKEHFSTLGLKSEEAPADFAVQVASGADAERLCDLFQGSVPASQRVERAMAAPTTSLALAEAASSTSKLGAYAVPFPSQTAILFKRTLKKLSRQTAYLKATILRGVLVSAAYGLLYHNVEKTPKSVAYDVFSLHFFVLLFVVMTNVQSVALTFDDRLLFERERAAQLYAVVPYWLATTAIYGTMALLNGFFISVSVGLASGLGSEAHSRMRFLATFGGVNALCALGGYAHCSLVSARSPTRQQATVLYTANAFVVLAVAGFLAKIPSFSPFLKICSKLSYARWGFQLLALHELQLPRGARLLGSEEAVHDLLAKTYGFNRQDQATCLLHLCICVTTLLTLHLIALRRTRSWERR